MYRIYIIIQGCYFFSRKLYIALIFYQQVMMMMINILPHSGKTELDRKMFRPFIMVTKSSTTLQSLGEQCAPVVGAKMWCLYVCFVTL